MVMTTDEHTCLLHEDIEAHPQTKDIHTPETLFSQDTVKT